MSPFPSLRLAALGLALLLAGCAPAEIDLVQFEDKTAGSGLEGYVGMTHGLAFGDFDGDGRPDLYVTNHLNQPRLFHNAGQGRFADVTAQWFAEADLGGDKHGAVWADYDNDGLLDLAQLTGAQKGVGAEAKRLFHREGDRFVNQAEALGVLNPDGRTRMPVWADLDGDGRLDLFHGAEARFDDKTPPFTFVQRGGRFEAALDLLTMASRNAPFCLVTQLDADPAVELICRVVGKGRTAQIFDTSEKPAKQLDLLPVSAFEDLAAADLDNDGRVDLVMARKNSPGLVAFGRQGEKEFVADLTVDKNDLGKTPGLSFRASGDVKFHVYTANPRDALTPQQIHLGAGGGHPSALDFQVSAASPGIAGMAAARPGVESGVHLGFTAPDRWEIRVAASPEMVELGRPRQLQVQLRVSASSPIADLKSLDDAGKDERAPLRLFMNRDGQLVEESDKRGVNHRLISGMSVVAGDFDNDMNVDLYVLGSGDFGPEESLFLRNRGGGKFQVVRGAGGAPGCTVGVGDAVAAADLDGDGFLDLVTACGGSMGRSLGLPSDGGGYRLYRNKGNGNHWLMIDLEGASSNRDGIGAIVRVTAGGVTQTRVQDGGAHHRGQNHVRLHFGLAGHARVERIHVQWPGGKKQEVKDQPADRLLRLKEPG